MLARLVEFSLAQRLLVLVCTGGLLIAGAVAYRDLPIDAFPDVSSTQVKVIVKAPGMTPEEVEARIAIPIEQELIGIPNKRLLRSTSKYAIADITLEFLEGTDIYWARNQVAERINTVMRDLPATASGGLAPITTPLGEMLMFTIDGDTLSLEQKRTLLERIIRPQLRTLPGVADVNSLGGLVRAFEVVPDLPRMVALGISMAALEEALLANNRNDGAGRLTDGEEALLVRVQGSVTTLQDLLGIVVAARGGRPVRVSDIASVRLGSLTRYGTVTQDGVREAVEGLVLGLRGANAKEVVSAVEEKLAELRGSLPAGISLTVFYNRGALVQRAVSTVVWALAEATGLVLALLVLFLGDVKSAVVVALALPLSILATFVAMRLSGLSANLMSLGGLAIAIGMLVDAAVVVVENIATFLSEHRDEAAHSPLHLIYRAVKEVTQPVASGVLIIVIVFLPLLTLQGLEGKLFVPVALTIVFALTASLAISLTVVPVLASFVLTRGAHRDPWLVRWLARLYEPSLRWAAQHARWVFAAAAVALVAAGLLYTRIGKSFMPALDEGDLVLALVKLPSISLQQSADTDRAIQKAILAAVPEVRGIVARVGSDELGLDPMGPNETDTFLQLKPRSEWRSPDRASLAGAIREVMRNFPGITYSFTQPIEMRVSEMLIGVRGDVAVKIYGSDLVQLNALAARTVELLLTLPGSEDVYTVKNAGVQYLRVTIDRLAAGRLGLTAQEVENDLRARLEGKTVGVVLEEAYRTPVLLRAPTQLADSPAQFSRIFLTTHEGHGVPMSSIARLERVDGPVKVDRENGRRLAVVVANVRGRDLVGFVDDARRLIAERVPLPAGYRLEWGGQFENQQRAAARLALVVPAALALIFLVLFATFGSVRQALLVLSNIPLALVGGVAALWISGEYLSVPASVGFIALMGIAVLNGVVMISYFNQLLGEGLPPDQAIRIGARRRLRPVLMTASITALGMIPLLLATGPGSEIQRPLAIVVTGGLVSSTVLTLFLLPLLYERFGVSVPKDASLA